MPRRERWIGIILLIVTLIFFQIGVQSIAPGKQPPAAAMIALQISTVLGFLGAGYVAAKRGRSKAWALLGFLSWIGIIIAFLLPNRSGKNAVEKPAGAAAPLTITRSTGMPTDVRTPTPAPMDALALILKCIDPYNIGAVSIEPAIEQLQREGSAGADRLAVLLNDLVNSRSEGAVYALEVATHLQPSPKLLDVLSRTIAAPPVTAGARGRFDPEIVGTARIGWTDRTHARVIDLARKALGSAQPAPPEAGKLRLPAIGPEFLASTFTPAEDPAGPGTGPFWEAIQCSNRHEADRAEAAFKQAVVVGLPPTCESYANCELGKLALAKGQLEPGVDCLLRALGAEKKSANVALDAAMRLQVIYAEALRPDEANRLAKLAASTNTRGLALTSKAEEELRELVRKRRLQPGPGEPEPSELGAHR